MTAYAVLLTVGIVGYLGWAWCTAHRWHSRLFRVGLVYQIRAVQLTVGIVGNLGWAWCTK
jgi:hypothetical protein